MVRRVPIVVVGLMLLVAACGGGTSDPETTGASDPETTVDTVEDAPDIPTELKQMAQFTCSQITGTTPAAAVPGITGLLERAAAVGYSNADVQIALRSECSDTMVLLEADGEVNSLFGT